MGYSCKQSDGGDDFEMLQRIIIESVQEDQKGITGPDPSQTKFRGFLSAYQEFSNKENIEPRRVGFSLKSVYLEIIPTI